MSRSGISENDLQAYVDGQLEAERRKAVERYLSEHPEEAERVAVWHRQNETLGALYGQISDEPVPPRLDVHRIAGALAASGWRRRPWYGIAAAAVLFIALGAAAGWTGRSYWANSAPGQTTLVADAVAAHSLYTREVLRPVEVGADKQTELTAWVSKRLGRDLVVPDLRPLGFRFVGGRLLPVEGQPAAQFMYEDETGQRITFLIVAENNGRESSLQYARTGDLNSFLWTDETIRCVLVGSLGRDRLRDIATLAYEQLG